MTDQLSQSAAMTRPDAKAAQHERGRSVGVHPPRCTGCRREWPCPDAVLLPIKPYTRYICPNDAGGGGHSSLWSGNPPASVRTTRDGYCHGCGAVLIEEADDGTRWRLSWECDTGTGWHPVVRETSSKRDAQSQRAGLLQLAAEGEPIRNVRMEKATVGWEPVNA